MQVLIGFIEKVFSGYMACIVIGVILGGVSAVSFNFYQIWMINLVDWIKFFTYWLAGS